MINAHTPDPTTWRGSLQIKLTSQRFHILILFLVVLDCIFVFCEMMIDLKLFEPPINNSTTHEHDETSKYHDAVLHNVENLLRFGSLAILSIFMVEVTLKIIAFEAHFFTQIEEVVDGIIVTVSFILDIVFINHDLLKYVGLLIVLRLWRMIRICHAIVITAKAPLQRKLEISERHQDMIETELRNAKAEIIELRYKLKINHSESFSDIKQTYFSHHQSIGGNLHRNHLKSASLNSVVSLKSLTFKPSSKQIREEL